MYFTIKYYVFIEANMMGFLMMYFSSKDHKFIPNERPPGNWPTVVKCIMQERKPVIYVWSFKFCEREKVSFPDVAHMTEHHTFYKAEKSGVIDESPNFPQNSEAILRTNSALEFSSKKIPLQFSDSQRYTNIFQVSELREIESNRFT